jgi:hypothetical protein
VKKNYNQPTGQTRAGALVDEERASLLPLVEWVERAEVALEELIRCDQARDHRGGAGTVGGAGSGRAAARPPRR